MSLSMFLKKSKFYLIVLTFSAFFFGALANAQSFSGAWVGEGEALGHLQDRDCSEIFFILNETADEFEIVTAGYICGMLQAEYPSSSFQKKDGDLYYRGRKVGFYSSSHLALEVPEEYYRLDLKLLESGQLRSTEKWDDGQSYLQVVGDLEFVAF